MGRALTVAGAGNTVASKTEHRTGQVSSCWPDGGGWRPASLEWRSEV